MPIDVIMPKLGESITEGTILEWKKKIGDSIEKDETILEISTDKVDSEVPSPASGKIIEIIYKVNDVVPVGEVIAKIGDSKDEVMTEASSKKSVTNNENKIVKNDVNKVAEQNANVLTVKNKISKSLKFYSPLVRSIAKASNGSSTTQIRLESRRGLLQIVHGLNSVIF